MGNRGNVIFTDGGDQFSPVVYLHWNGGPESVYAFLAELDRRHVRADQEYEAARFVAIAAEFFDQEKYGGHSLGIVNFPEAREGESLIERLGRVRTDPGDNGFYLVDRTKPLTEVRRFRETWNGRSQLVELTAEQAAAEKRGTIFDEYAEGIAQVYAGKEVSVI